MKINQSSIPKDRFRYMAEILAGNIHVGLHWIAAFHQAKDRLKEGYWNTLSRFEKAAFMSALRDAHRENQALVRIMGLYKSCGI